MKSYDKPTDEQVEAAMPLLSSPQHEAYFFSQLENPHWIMPLKNRGMFDNPPKVEHVKGGGIRFPLWPASQYLAKMAPHAPTEVASIFIGLETHNESIIRDIINAALAMPSAAAKTLVPRISQAMQKEILSLNFKDASDLCVRLAEGGEAKAAMDLAEALFTPKFEEGQEEPSRRDEYWYKAGLKKVIPVMAGREPRAFLMKLCEWLKVSVDAKKHVDPASGSDYSYMWRPAIEEHGQNLDYEFAGVMVGFVRQGFEQAIRDESLSLGKALEIIAPYSYVVFRRIKVHLINEFAEQNAALARQIMMNRDLFDDHRYKHEYAMLVGRRLDLLTPEDRATWFGWIDAGPDMSDFDQTFKERLGRDATDEDRQNRINYWKFKKMHWVRKHLEGERKKFYEDMLAKHGKPELADLNVRIDSGRWGHNSPMTVDELSKVTFEQAVERVSSWTPGEQSGFMGPDIEGLASTFGQYVATNPSAFSTKAEALIERPAIYVRTFISNGVLSYRFEKQLIARLELRTKPLIQDIYQL